MRLAILVLAATMLAPGAAALALAPAAPAEGCAERAAGFSCRWTYETPATPTREWASFGLPPVEGDVVETVTVLFDGTDGGWQHALLADARCRGEYWGYHLHNTPAGEASATIHRETLASVLTLPDKPLFLCFYPGGRGATSTTTGNVQSGNFDAVALSRGRFTVTLTVERVPEGVPAAHPAATRDDPQLRGPAGDARYHAYDLVAVWFDDPRLGDGLFDVRLALAGSNDFPVRDDQYSFYAVLFGIGRSRYQLAWRLEPNATGAGMADAPLTCSFVLVNGEQATTLSRPRCALDAANATLSATIPESSVGSPSDGVPFTDLSASVSTQVIYQPFGTTVGQYQTEDELNDQRYPFALGGPAVWDLLNPRLAIAPPQPAPWYRDPISKDNLPNTMQVGGSVAAAGTFLVGAVVVQRRRHQTRLLLDEIESVERLHEGDSGRALLELGRLESRFTRMLREAKITEAQWQTLSQRIASSATRFALRRELGLEEAPA